MDPRLVQAALLGPSLAILNSLQITSTPPSQHYQGHDPSKKRSHLQSTPIMEEDDEEDLGEMSVADTLPRYKGVSQHRRSGRWESHIWLASKKSQAYLGGFQTPEAAAEAYDCIALKSASEPGSKSRRKSALVTNFDPELYADLLESWNETSLDEAIMSIRRQSSGFSRGSSSFRGVTKHPSGKYEARIGLPSVNQANGNKHIYLGLHEKEEDAARSYDAAVIRMKGFKAATNYPMSDYPQQLDDYKLREDKMDNGEEELAAGSTDYEHWVKYGGEVELDQE